MESCHFCGNKNLKNDTTQYTYKRDGKFVNIDDVPCIKCEFCGEQFFSAKVLKIIEREFEAIHLKGKRVNKEIVVPMETFSEIDGLQF